MWITPSIEGADRGAVAVVITRQGPSTTCGKDREKGGGARMSYIAGAAGDQLQRACQRYSKRSLMML